MPRVVTVDPGLQAHAQACVQARVDAEVGVLVGRCAAGKDLVVQAIKAPNRDGVAPLEVTAGGAAPKKGGAKGGRAGGAAGGGLSLDEEWVVEHAAMVERLLPGGLDVVGFYLLCPSAAFTGGGGALASLAEAAGKEGLAAGLPSLLLLHCDSVSGGLALRELPAGVRGAAPRPAEMRAAPALDQLITVTCRHPLDLHLPVTSGKQELQAAFQAAADAAAQRLRGAQGLVGGALAGGGVQLGDLAAAAGCAAGPLPVELLLQPSASLAFCAAGGGKAGSGLQHGRAEARTLGAASLAGVLDCRGCVHRREPAAAAVEALCADVRRSLQARLDALLDAAEQEQEAAAAELEQQQRQARSAGGGGGGGAAPPPPPPPHPLFVVAAAAGKPLAVALPRRAFVASSAAGGLPFCDYLFEGESSQAMLGRLQMLLPWPELAGAAVECLEVAAPAAARPGSAGAKARGGGGGGGGGRGAAAALPCTLVTAGSVAAAALALAIGYLSLSSGQ